VFNNEGTYQVIGNTFITNPDLMNKGKPVRFWFEHGELLIKVDDEVPGRFHRIP
jgi:hypothetical protein